MSRLHPFFRAALALATACAAASPAAAALSPADLVTTISANTGTVNASSAVSYFVTVSNPALLKRVCALDPDTHRPVCEMVPNSLNALGVTVDINLAGGQVATGGSGDSGFSCSVLSATLLRCFNGNIAAEDAGHITVTARSSNAGGTISTSAMADPGNTIAERSETNNGASVAVTVRPPVNTNLPDLFATVSTAQSTFNGRTPVDFDVRIYNLGPVDAINATLEYRAVFQSEISTPSFSPSNPNIVCPFIVGNGGLFTGVRCNGLFVPANSSILMRVRMIPFWNPPLQAGTNYVMYGTLDPDGVMQELNESNNLFNRGVLVMP